MDPALNPVRVVVRPHSTPFPLGFFGLAGASAVLAALEIGIAPSSEKTQAAVLVLVFAPVPQLVASIFGFLSRDPAAATGMGVLSVTWTAIGLATLLGPPGGATAALGVLLFVAAAAIFVSTVVAAEEKLAPALVYGVVGLRFVLTGIHEVTGAHAWNVAAAITGFVLSAVAVYAATGLELEGSKRKPLGATMRHDGGRRALLADLVGQMDGVEREPGVRRSL